MQVRAELRHLRMAPRKVRLVADLIRGLDVVNAKNELQFINRSAAKPLLKLLKSALANGENNLKLKKDNLYVSEIKVDEGPILKRWMPRARGSASRMNKRTSHISLVLNEKIETKTKEEAKESIKKEDVKIVNSLEDVKELETKENLEDLKDKNVKDNGQHITKSQKTGRLKRIFRRKSV